jgi:hypothetical protein
VGQYNCYVLTRPGLALIAIIACAGFSCDRGATPADEATRTFGEAKLVTQVKDGQLKESSGVASSHRNANSFYTHNDSGDSARFFRFDRSGKITGTFNVKNAKAIDWEDMASAKFGENRYLYFGDIGDNRGARSEVVVYRVSEPAGGSGTVTADRTYVLTYPDGPHNAEALLVHPATGDLTIVTKTSKGPSRVYVLANPKRSGTFKMTHLGQIEFSGSLDLAKLVTGGAYAPDGKQVVVRTYLGAYEYAVPADGNWTKSSPLPIKTGLEFQGEAICYSADGKSLITTSEGNPCPVNEIKIGS